MVITILHTFQTANTSLKTTTAYLPGLPVIHNSICSGLCSSTMEEQEHQDTLKAQLPSSYRSNSDKAKDGRQGV